LARRGNQRRRTAMTGSGDRGGLDSSERAHGQGNAWPRKVLPVPRKMLLCVVAKRVSRGGSLLGGGHGRMHGLGAGEGGQTTLNRVLACMTKGWRRRYRHGTAHGGGEPRMAADAWRGEDSRVLRGVGALGKSRGLDGVRASGGVAARTPRRPARGRGAGAFCWNPFQLRLLWARFSLKN
jgi:hypothetical protein